MRKVRHASTIAVHTGASHGHRTPRRHGPRSSHHDASTDPGAYAAMMAPAWVSPLTVKKARMTSTSTAAPCRVAPSLPISRHG